MRAVLRLIRLPNVITALADAPAGYLFLEGHFTNPGRVAWLAGVSACLYAGGVALNDWCDRSLDRAARPERPLPSGQVSPAQALCLAIALLLAGLALSVAAGGRCAWVAAALVGCIVSYDVGLKHTWAGPVVMGGCRSLNVALGMSAATGALEDGLIPLGLMGLYVSSLTCFARHETGRVRRRDLAAGLLGMGLAVAGLLSLAASVRSGASAFIGWVVVLSCLWGGCAAYVVQRADAFTVRRAVSVFVLGIVLLDASFVWAGASPWAAAFLAACVVPGALAARRIPMA